MTPEKMKEHQDNVLAALANGHMAHDPEDESIYRDVVAVSVRLLMLEGRLK